MTTTISNTKQSGTKTWAILKSDSDKELNRMSDRLNLPVHGKGSQEPHLDVPTNKIRTALKYGAVLLPIFCCGWYYMVLV